jgi:hypothetical protein
MTYQIDDICGLFCDHVIAVGRDGRLYCSPTSLTGFAALRSAVVNYSTMKWDPWETGDDAGDIADNLRDQARRDHGFPIRRDLTPALSRQVRTQRFN